MRYIADCNNWQKNENRWSCPGFVDGVGKERTGDFPMPSTHTPYAPEYRRRIIELARAGRSINQLAREFEPSATVIRKWVKQAALDDGALNRVCDDLDATNERDAAVEAEAYLKETWSN